MSQVGRRRAIAAVSVVIAVLSQAAIVSLAAPGPSAPPPTPVPPDGHLSPFPSRLQTPARSARPPEVSASAALLVDLDSGTILFQRAPDAPRPIASLTKIMTALLVLERLDLDDQVKIGPGAVFERGDYGAGSTLGLREGERITVEDLLYALMLGSANDAAEALAIEVSGGVDAFVEMMNRRAKRLGMVDTRFRSPHGLDDRGVSTPRDVVTLVRAALEDPRFTEITSARFHRIPAPQGPDRRIQNRNALLWLYPDAFGIKTGYTDLAGYSLAAAAERGDRRLAVVVLDADGEAFSDAAALLNHGFEGFEARTLVSQGDALGDVALRGGSVPVTSGGTVEALVPVTASDQVRIVLRPDPAAAFPPAPGERIGTASIRTSQGVVDQVSLVATRPPMAPEPDSAWWLRTLSSVVDAVERSIRALAS